jgi:hypothetical protein
MKYVGIGYSDHLTSGLNFYFYNKSQFEYSIEQRFIVPVVFFGLTFRDDSDF